MNQYIIIFNKRKCREPKLMVNLTRNQCSYSILSLAPAFDKCQTHIISNLRFMQPKINLKYKEMIMEDERLPRT